MQDNNKLKTENFNNLLNLYIQRIFSNPSLLVPALTAWVRGWWYKFKFKIQFKKFSAGRYFRVYGPLVVSGPGEVRFGDNCLIISNAIKPVCIRTVSKNAKVTLGDHAGLNGTSIQCVKNIAIGELSNIADAYITDTSAHSLGINRRVYSTEEVNSKEVVIGKNVWISVQVVILHGVTVGDNSVLGACSLVRNDVPQNVFAAGNPLKIIKTLEE